MIVKTDIHKLLEEEQDGSSLKVLLSRESNAGASSELSALYMSLALDDELTPEEVAEFEQFLAEDAELNEEWRVWQQLDAKLWECPPVAPVDGFLQRFEYRLAQQENQKQLWFGTVVGVITLGLWGILLLGAVSFGLLVWWNQSGWLGEVLQQVTYLWAIVASWGSALWSVVTTLLATPQGKGLVVFYLFATATILLVWAWLLRRTTQLQDLTSV
jgi:hypothetical protein